MSLSEKSGQNIKGDRMHSQSCSLTVRLPSWQAATPNFLFQESSLPVRSQFHALCHVCLLLHSISAPSDSVTEFLGMKNSYSPSKKSTAFAASQARAGGCSCCGLTETPLCSHIQKEGLQWTHPAALTASQCLRKQLHQITGESQGRVWVPVLLVPLLTIK